MKNQNWTLKAVREEISKTSTGKLINPDPVWHVSLTEEAITRMNENIYGIEDLLEEHSEAIRELDRTALVKDCKFYIDGDVDDRVYADFVYYSKKTILEFLDTLDIAVFKNNYKGFSMNVAKVAKSEQSDEDKCCSLISIERNANLATHDLYTLCHFLAQAAGESDDDWGVWMGYVYDDCK